MISRGNAGKMTHFPRDPAGNTGKDYNVKVANFWQKVQGSELKIFGKEWKRGSNCLYHRHWLVSFVHKIVSWKNSVFEQFWDNLSQKLGQILLIFTAISRSPFPAGIFPQTNFLFPREMRESCQAKWFDYEKILK